MYGVPVKLEPTILLASPDSPYGRYLLGSIFFLFPLAFFGFYFAFRFQSLLHLQGVLAGQNMAGPYEHQSLYTV